MPPVGKSGPRTKAIRSRLSADGSSIRCIRASHISRRLWGGMFVAMPTAMPDEPFTRRLGNFDGSTTGSFSEASKLSTKSTVSLSMSSRRSSAIFSRRHSV
ncbi:MAG: hypothetical protein A4E31_00679 [Methanomassiliicoccales archaeon PtaU1.Bin030]|nr:MAG: hypothetical protein A4E31_00679 [Methanomassiliicoccales archaeon PtaU1.Bin030]